MRRPKKWWKKILLVAMGFALLVCVFVSTRPTFSSVAYQFADDAKWNAASFPLIVEGAPPGKFAVEFVVHLPRVHPTSLYFMPDDCIDRLIINGSTVTDSIFPFCNFRMGRSASLLSYLQPGENHIAVHMRNLGWPAGLDVRVPPYDPLSLIILFCFVCIVCGALGTQQIRKIIGTATKHGWLTAREWKQCIAFGKAAIFVCIVLGAVRGFDALFARVFYELSNPYTADLSLYLALGRGILNGLTPYVDLFENKPPGMFLLAASSLALFDGPQLLHLMQGAILVGFPYVLFIWYVLNYTLTLKGLRDARMVFLLVNTVFFGIGIGLYTMLRSGEAQIESYGAFLGVLYLLIVARCDKPIANRVLLIASIPLLGAIGFKEPFILSLFAGALVLTVGHFPDILQRFFKPLLLAALFGLVAMMALGYLWPYLAVYLGEMFGHHIPQSGSPVFRALNWHRLWLDVKDFSTGFVWSIALMTGYSLWIRWKQSRSLEDMMPPIGSLLFAITFTTFAVAMTNVYFNHHFVFAVPLYAAIFLRFFQDIYHDRSRVAFSVLTLNTLLLTWAMCSHATMNYSHLLQIFQQEPVSAQKAAAAVDEILDACGIDRYFFLGKNGPQPYAYTKHSPMGPLFMQYGYSLSPDRTYFRAEFLRALSEAQLVVQESFALADLHDEVTAYLEEEFTEEPWGCAQSAAYAIPQQYVVLYRNHE